MTGLAIAFLVVLLASVVSRSARDNNPPTAAEENAAMNSPSEPLAELGVAPGADKNQQASANTAGK